MSEVEIDLLDRSLPLPIYRVNRGEQNRLVVNAILEFDFQRQGGFRTQIDTRAKKLVCRRASPEPDDGI